MEQGFTKGDNAFMEGGKYLENKEYDKAAEAFTEAINLGCTEKSKAYTYRGNSYIETGQYAEAVSDHTIAITLDPKNPFAYAQRGASFYRIDMENEAIEDLEKALSIDPDNEVAKEILRQARGCQETDQLQS